MAKTSKSLFGKRSPKVSGAEKAVLNTKTGKYVMVKGVGALKGDDLKLKKGVSLLKPIAKQALARRSEKRRAG